MRHFEEEKVLIKLPQFEGHTDKKNYKFLIVIYQTGSKSEKEA